MVIAAPLVASPPKNSVPRPFGSCSVFCCVRVKSNPVVIVCALRTNVQPSEKFHVCTVRRDPGQSFPWPWRLTDLGDPDDTAAAVREHDATAVLHLAIDNDLLCLYRDRRSGGRMCRPSW